MLENSHLKVLIKIHFHFLFSFHRDLKIKLIDIYEILINV